MLGCVSVFEGDYSSGKQHLLNWLSTRPSMKKAMKSVSVYCRFPFPAFSKAKRRSCNGSHLSGISGPIHFVCAIFS